MLKLVVKQSGHPDREFVVPGDVATIGRVSSCDVVINEPFVSKQHVQILHGTVIVDLGSSNGTFVEGRRLTQPILLEGRTVEISQNGVELSVESDGPEGGDTALAGDELEQLRSEYAVLEAEVARLKRELVQARDTADQDELVGRLTGENESLRERLESLKEEIEGRELEDGDSIQAKLAMQRIERVQEANEKLQAQVDGLRAELDEREAELEVRGAAVAPPPEMQSAELVELRKEVSELRAELESERQGAHQHENQTQLIRKLRKELEALRAGAPGGGSADLEHALEEKKSEAAELRARVGELEGRLAQAAPAPEGNVSDLFFKLQSENMELKKRLAAVEGEGGQAEPGKRDMKTVRELMEARLRIAALETELSNLKVTSTRSPTGAPPVPAKPVPAKPVPARSAPAASAGFDAHRILEVVVDQDVEALERPASGPAEEFVMVETVRLMRHVERVVTRVAGDLIQLFQLQTMLPDTAGTFRGIVADLMAEPDRDEPRERLVEYLETLGRWLVAAIGAHRKAAVLFAGKIKEDLSEKRLTARDPLPAYARVPMLAGNELWRRVQSYLVDLSPDAIDEGIDELAREQAQRLINETS